MLVMKFGGTSVGNAKNIAGVAAIVHGVLKRKPVVVVSAVTKITDALIRLADEAAHGKGDETLAHICKVHRDILTELELPSILCDKELVALTQLVRATQKAKKKTLSKKTLDEFQSFGERLSSVIVAAAIGKRGVKSQAFPAWELGMITDDRFGAAEPLPTTAALLKKKITALSVVPVITGFIGKTKKGDIVTLGRGGSDYTAAVIGAAIGAESIQIWKEVDGILSTDPRIVPQAKIVHELAFEEACELAYFGAKVLHPKTILPAMEKGIPVQVLNTFSPAGKGSTIVSSFTERSGKSHTVEALAFRKGISVIHVRSSEFFDGSGLMSKVFAVFEKYKTSIDVVTTSVVSVSLTVDQSAADSIPKIVKALEAFGEVTVVRGKAIVCAVGGSINAAGVTGRIFTLLGEHKIPVEMISQAASGISITFVVEEADAPKSVVILHKAFIE